MMKTLKQIQCMAVVLCGAAILGSCSKGESIIPETPEGSGVPIAFTTPDNWGDIPDTRATTTDKGTTFDIGDQIRIYADYYPADGGTPTEFMFNQVAEYVQDANKNNGEAFWQYSPIKYWPTMKDDQLKFFSYFPYDTHVTAERTIENGVPSYKLHLDAPRGNVDLLATTSTDGFSYTSVAGGAVPLTFQHLLVKVNACFKWTTTDPDVTVTEPIIEKIVFNGVPYKATYTLGSGWGDFEGNKVTHVIPDGTFVENEEKKIHVFLLPGQSITSLIITINNKDYTYTPKNKDNPDTPEPILLTGKDGQELTLNFAVEPHENGIFIATFQLWDEIEGKIEETLK